MRARIRRMGRWRFLVYASAGLLVFIASVFIYAAHGSYRTSREIAIETPDGIQSLETVLLGGVEQSIYLRSLDASNPVLLFLHGGPGMSEMVPVRHYNRELEEHFVVVTWDQRGAGKSFSPDIPEETMTLGQIVEDTLELTRMLRERFNVDRIYLVGHSWGSIVGVHAADRYPDFYHAYVGVGQAVDFVEAEKISYQFTLDRARALGNEKAVRELQDIGSPPYPVENFAEFIGVQRKWLFRFGGEVYGETNNLRYVAGILGMHLVAPEYSIGDTVNLVRGNQWSGHLLLDDLHATNLPDQVPTLDVPTYFFVGRHDYVTVFEKVESYYEVLGAPHSELVWFEESAHSPNFEEPDRFAREMLRVREESVRR